METLLKTPLYNYHIKLGGRMIKFAGWEMPVQFSGILNEVRAVRESSGIFDVSHMGEIFLTGEHCSYFIDRMITNDISKMTDGSAMYTLICKEDGGVLDDTILYRFNENSFLFCVNAINTEKIFQWFIKNRTDNVKIENRSMEYALISLQGPCSENILRNIFDTTSLNYYHFKQISIKNNDIIISRTGYTGEDGFELFIPWHKAEAIYSQILKIGQSNVVPAGLGARDVLRIEAGLPLYGHEISEEITPIEAKLKRFVKFNRYFIGYESLKKKSETGINKILTGFIIEGRTAIPREGMEIMNSKKEIVGNITSGTFSPTLNKPIAMGFISNEEVSDLFIEVRGKMFNIKKVDLPFVPHRIKK